MISVNCGYQGCVEVQIPRYDRSLLNWVFYSLLCLTLLILCSACGKDEATVESRIVDFLKRGKDIL